MGTERTKPEFPRDTATDPVCRTWLEWAFSIPPASRIGEVTRYGGVDDTPMTMQVCHPGNGERLVRWEEERHASKHANLRAALTRDADLRGEHITNAEVAGDAYYLLCKLARVVGGSDPRDMVRDWVAGYRDSAARVRWALDKRRLHGTLDELRRYPYSKRHITAWLNAMERLGSDDRSPPPPRPPLIVYEGREWTSITHLGTYVRWGRDHAGAISDTALAGLVVELGGDRWRADAWDTTTRQRQNRITTILVRLPTVNDDGEAPDV